MASISFPTIFAALVFLACFFFFFTPTVRVSPCSPLGVWWPWSSDVSAQFPWGLTVVSSGVVTAEQRTAGRGVAGPSALLGGDECRGWVCCGGGDGGDSEDSSRVVRLVVGLGAGRLEGAHGLLHAVVQDVLHLETARQGKLRWGLHQKKSLIRH